MIDSIRPLLGPRYEAWNEVNLSWPVDVLLDDGETRWLTLSPALGPLDRRATWSVHF